MDPIATTVMLTGEDAIIRAPAAVKPYRPGDPAPYAPNAPTDFPVRGITEGKIELIDGADGAFTIQASAWPTGLKAEAAKLIWRGRPCRVLKLRERYFLGVMNGVTIFWAA